MQRILKVAAALFCALTLVFSAVYQHSPAPILLSLAISFGCFAYHLLMRLAVGFVFDGVMKNRADPSASWYRPRPWEKELYKKLRVKNWKGRFPSYEPSLFDPKKHSWNEIAQAMCQAELVHECIALLSFLPLLTVPFFGAFPVFFFTSLFAAVFDLHFALIQRYNRPRIMKLTKR